MALKPFLLIFLLYSCKEATELKIVRDNDFFDPPIRNDRIIDGKLFYYLGERYYVFGYDPDNHKFDSTMQKLICDKLKGDIPLSIINIDFESVGRYAAYHEGDNLSADFTKELVSVSWDIEESNIIKTEWGSNFPPRIIPLDCSQHLK